MLVFTTSAEPGSSGKCLHHHCTSEEPRHVPRQCTSRGIELRHPGGSWQAKEWMQSSCPEPLLTRLFLSMLSHRGYPAESRRAGLWVGLKKIKLVMLGAAVWWQEEKDALPSTWKRDERGEKSQSFVQSWVAWEGWLRNACVMFHPLQRLTSK